MLNLQALAEIFSRYGDQLSRIPEPTRIGGRIFNWGERTAIMGVINLSKDSWYRESVCLNTQMARERAAVLVAQGADVIDIGAESSLNHADRVSAARQLDQLLPLISAGAELGAAISVETYHQEVADRCLRAGASILNLTGGTDDPEIYKIAARHNAAVIICFVDGDNVREVDKSSLAESQSPVSLLRDYFERTTGLARDCGVSNILIDPGLGFYYRNLEDSSERVRFQTQVFLEAGILRDLGYPICQALPHAFEFFGEEVRSAEPYFAMLAALGGTNLFRTHEVPKVRAVLRTMACYNNKESEIHGNT